MTEMPDLLKLTQAVTYQGLGYLLIIGMDIDGLARAIRAVPLRPELSPPDLVEVAPLVTTGLRLYGADELAEDFSDPAGRFGFLVHQAQQAERVDGPIIREAFAHAGARLDREAG